MAQGAKLRRSGRHKTRCAAQFERTRNNKQNQAAKRHRKAEHWKKVKLGNTI